MDEPATQPSDVASPLPATEPQFRTYASDVAKLTGIPLQKTVIKNTPAPQPQPVEPPPAKIIPKAPSTEESREAVLARLRTKAAEQGTPPQAPPPQKPIPHAPSTGEAREEVLARLKAKAVTQPTPPPGLPPVVKPEVVAPSPIHTYKSDFSQKAKTERATPISILAQEQNARGTKPPPQLQATKRNYVPLVAGAILLILAGGTSIYFAISFVTGRPPITVSPTIPSLIFADTHVELSGKGFELQQKLADMQRTNLPVGGVAVAYVSYASTTEKGATLMLPAEGGALISALDLSAPDILLRNIDANSTVGVVRAGTETLPFFIFKVNSYERTFAGMLSWEASMRHDLQTFYPDYPEETTTDSSSTPQALNVQPIFVDAVIQNHDVRVLRDGQNRSLILYGYRDKTTLIIARDENAFSELLKRLASTRSK